jgi:hypothetical protein
MKKIIDFLVMGFLTPFIYGLVSLAVILSTFLIGVPIAIGMKLVNMFIYTIFGG